jgi:ATP-dependent exoDNAse (exonuclease V) beta subunit
MEERGDNATPLAADIGTLVHRYLEMIATDGLEHWSSSRVLGLTDNVTRWFATRGYDSDQCNVAVADVIQHLISTTESPEGRWILSPHEEAQSEVPITNSVGDTLQSHVIDRTFIDQGVRWIIDFKTTKTEIQNQTALAEETTEGFRQQLERYKSLYSGKNQEIRLGVFLTHHGRLHVLNSGNDCHSHE